MNKENAIGVFDSGIGGLTVLRQLIRFLPYEKYIYLGDTARVPYGNKSENIVQKYSKECTSFLIEKNVKLIVVACNTSSSVGIDAVKETAGEIPVIGVILPAAGAALRATINGKIGIIGTRATINSAAYEKGIISLNGGSQVEIFSQACPLFVPFAEEGMIRHDATKMIAEEYLYPFKEHGIDTLVLGCTHYPILSQLIGDIMPGISLIDSGEHAAVNALRLLAEEKCLAELRDEFIMKPEIDFYVTDLPTIFNEQAQRFLGFPIDHPNKVTIGKF